MDVYFCQTCKLKMSINDKQTHENGKKHKILANDTSLKVFIKGYPAHTKADDIRKLASRFGNAKLEIFNRAYSIVQFETSEQVEDAIAGQVDHLLFGRTVMIRYFEPSLITLAENQIKALPKRQFVLSKRKEIITGPQDIDLSGDFNKQCEAILAAIRLTREEVESISLLYSNLTELFQNVWPGCVAVPFGSITTGLGIKTSDADCFIDIPPLYRQGGLYSYVPKAKNLMHRYPQIFTEILAIPRANTPIVKFFHIPTNINCDVSFKTPLGSRNSQLVAFLLRSDSRILYLCILIKYWAKVHGLTGCGKLSNYALTMLVIFYLQQQPDPLLHSVQLLQRGQNWLIDYWNTGFINEHHLLPAFNSKATLCDLFGGFFQFYKKFNFKEEIVCPYLGVAIKKNSFVNYQNLSDVFELYKHNVHNKFTTQLNIKGEIVIQDPFEHCHNVSSCVGLKLFNEITQSIAWAADIYTKDKENKYENFLRKILLQKPVIKPVQAKTFKLVLNPHVLNKLDDDEWKDLVRTAFMNIFRDILKFNVVKQEAKESAIVSNKKDKESYMCKSSRLVWNRAQVDDPEPDFLAKQIAITKTILKHRNPATVSMHVIVDILFMKEMKMCHIICKLENDIEEKFGEFTNFCMRKVGYWFQSLLLTHIDRSKTPIKEGELLNFENEKEQQTAINVINKKEKSKHAKRKNKTNKPGTSGSHNHVPVVAENSTGKSVDCTSTESKKTELEIIPKRTDAFLNHPDSSPDSNPPMKIQKKD